MMKKINQKIIIGTAALIVLMIYVILFVIFSYSTIKMISFIIFIIGLGAALATTLILNKKQWLQTVVFYRNVLIYCVASNAFSLLIVTLEACGLPLQLKYYLSLHFIILGVCLVLFVPILLSKRYIDARQTIVEKKVKDIRLLHAKMNSIYGLAKNSESLNDSEVISLFTEILEGLRYADPMTNSETEYYNSKITFKLNDLLDYVEAQSRAKAIELSREILLVIKDRENYIKITKSSH